MDQPTAPGGAVRPAVVADLAAVAEIYAHYVTHTVTTFEEVVPEEAAWRERHRETTGRGLPFLVAEEAGTVVGYAYAGAWRPKPAYRHTVEDSLYLAPGHTGRGLGGALLRGVLAGAARAGARQMVAVIADTGVPASAALHRRHGFQEVGRLVEVGHKHGRWVDTVLMQRALGGD
ncbi:GNAT family N-acetyltransferase [Streptomyces triticirhizae]|uniref:N-acetyltransferase family protein n=1 Tax=Streptomyces triticirhizae TaxID=2483353 RepID=A0A3M2L924_9ACTN|nr:GNAT family N-acetyltransferase [Streptomyces triticirhizae]RMI33200.1 N-acetyltransferase family protein [Streptomyces triticirhizae]